MPLFGLIPKKNKSTPALQQQANQHAAHPPSLSPSSSPLTRPPTSTSYAPSPSSTPGFVPPKGRHAHRSSVSSIPASLNLLHQSPSSLTLDALPPSASSRPRAGTTSSGFGEYESSVASGGSPTRTRMNPNNTTPVRTPHSRPSFEKNETFGIRRIPGNSSSAGPSSSSQQHGHGSYLTYDPDSNGLLGNDSNEPRRSSGSTRTDLMANSSSTADGPLQPPSRSTIFGSSGGDPRSQLSTQSLPDDALGLGARSRARSSASNSSGTASQSAQKPQRPLLTMRQAAPRSGSTPSERELDDREHRDDGWSGSQFSHLTMQTTMSSATNGNGNGNSSSSGGGSSKSKVFGWLSFRGASKSHSAAQTQKTPSRDRDAVIPPVPTPSSSLSVPSGDIADRARRLPQNIPPDSPSPQSRSSSRIPQGNGKPTAPPSPLHSTMSTSLSYSSSADLSPSSPEELLPGPGAESTFRVTNFRHVSPANAASYRASPPPPNKKRTKSISSFTSSLAGGGGGGQSSSRGPKSPSSPSATSPPSGLAYPSPSPRPRMNTSSSSLLDSSDPNSNSFSPPVRPRSRNDSLTSASESGSGPSRVTAAAFRQAAQARRSSISSSPLITGVGVGMNGNGRASVDSLALLPPAAIGSGGGERSRSGTPTSVRSFGAGPMLSLNSPVANGNGNGTGDSPASSSRTFIMGMGHHRRQSTQDSIGSDANDDSIKADFANASKLLNSSSSSPSSPSPPNKPLGRQDTITQRSVSSSALAPASASAMRRNESPRVPRLPPTSPSGTLAKRADSAFVSSSPIAAAAERLGPAPASRGPPPRSQSALGTYARSPASRSTPNVGSGGGRPMTIAALSHPDVDSDTSEEESERSSGDSSDDDDAPLAPPPRPGTSMSTRTTSSIGRPSSVPLTPENVGKSGLPRPPRSSTMPSEPLVSLSGNKIAQTSKLAPSGASASSFKKPSHPAASRSVDALHLPSPPPASSKTSPTPPASSVPSPSAHSFASRKSPTTTLLDQRESRLHEMENRPHPTPAHRTQTFPLISTTASPASSIGDSSSGKLPVTPRDGSELGWQTHASPAAAARGRRTSMDGQSTLTPATARNGAGRNGSGNGNASVAGETIRHAKRPSVSFDVAEVKELRGILKEPSVPKERDVVVADEAEAQRRERRRSEARAAIELGNVVNGPPPVVDVNLDMPSRNSMAQLQNTPSQMNLNAPMNWDQWRMSQFNLNAAGGMPPMPLQPQSTGASMNPMMMAPPPNADPAFLAAHQQAMMIAKQTYQFAVAQQALAAANDEWERGSNATGYTRTVGGGGPPSMYGMNFNMPMMGMGMNGMPGMPMGMMGLPSMPSMFPAAPQSMYAGGGGSVAGSTMGGGGWGAQSVYGASFGGNASSPRPNPGRRVTSGTALNDGTASVSGGLNRPPRPRTKTSPSGQGASTAAAATAAARSRGPAPTSWRLQ